MEKKCSICNKVLPKTEYYSQVKYSKSKGEYIYYYPYCKRCTSKKSQKWNSENSERREKILEKYEGTEMSNSRFKRANEKRNDTGYQKEWAKNNKDKLKQYSNNRQEKKHEITELEWKECLKFFKDCCAYCGISNEEAIKKYSKTLNKDHIDSSGSNKINNCVPACTGCNSSKRKRSLDEYFNYSSKFNKEMYNRILRWLGNFNDK